MVPLFSDETIGKHMRYGSRAFVHNVNEFGPKEWTLSIFPKKNDFVKKSLKMWLA
jgi:hypothetical protein